MTPRAFVLTYHAIAPGPPPLYVGADLLARHLDCIVDSGAAVLTVSELAGRLGAGALSGCTVALTFDDGFASVATVAAPLLAARGLKGTVFCVSGHIGGVSGWPSQPSSAPRLPLADAEVLRDLAAAGWEIGSHSVGHEPLGGQSHDVVHHELAESRRALEHAVDAIVTSLAWPYGSVPQGARAILEETGYDAACSTEIARVGPGTSPLALPRIDAHYLRRPAVLAALLAGRLPGYLGARRMLASARRQVVADYARPAGTA